MVLWSSELGHCSKFSGACEWCQMVLSLWHGLLMMLFYVCSMYVSRTLTKSSVDVTTNNRKCKCAIDFITIWTFSYSEAKQTVVPPFDSHEYIHLCSIWQLWLNSYDCHKNMHYLLFRIYWRHLCAWNMIICLSVCVSQPHRWDQLLCACMCGTINACIVWVTAIMPLTTPQCAFT